MSALRILTLSLLLLPLAAQETRFNAFTGKQDYVASFYWKAVGAGVLASRPATCTANKDMYICNGAGCTAGSNIHYCTATDTWTVQGGSGTVTSVATTSPITGGPITTTGTIACATCVTSAAALTSNAVVIGGGLQASSTITASTTTTHALFATAIAPAFRAVAVSDLPSSTNKGTWGIGLDGGGSAITTGVKGEFQIPYACTITEWTILLDQSGSIVIDIWKDTYANYPPTVADTITGSAKPTVTTATKNTSTTLTGWTTSVTAADTIRFNVDSITTATRATLLVYCTKT